MTDKRKTAESVAYMELHGARKDSDCSRVKVEGGVSSKLGCCNDFKPDSDARHFRCGTCVFIRYGEL